jgi:hypothetical protein
VATGAEDSHDGAGSSDGTVDGSNDGSGSTCGGHACNGIVYIESNDPAANSIIGFQRAADGSLSSRATRTFKTGDLGITAGPDQRLGPLDSDQNLVMSADQTLLYAVNSGGNTISVFQIGGDGLQQVPGSPFDSGGQNPVSIGIARGVVHVVNKAASGAVTPNYALLAARGAALQAIPGTTLEADIGASPSIAYITPDQRFMFGTRFLDGARPMSAPVGQIDAFRVEDDGRLTPVDGAPYALPPDTSGIEPPPPPVALNMVAHPKRSILYVGFPTRNQIGVYTYDPSCGTLTFVRTVPNSGKAVCWFLINAEASQMYTVNSVSGTLSVYDLSKPLEPVETSAIQLKQAMSGPPFIDAMGMKQTVTSQPFEFAFDREQKHLYVVSQRATTNADDPTGNYLHTLSIATDGTLSEPGDPIDLRDVAVPPAARPQGVLVVR